MSRYGDHASDLRDRFVGAMGRVASSVSVVTTDGDAGRFGVTIGAMTSVSADPPMLLVCIPRDHPAARALLANGMFAVNVLAADQVEVAASFAGNPLRGSPYDFNPGQWRFGPYAAPLLAGAAVSFACSLLEAHEGGTHSIFIGAVNEAAIGSGEPLMYGNELYGRHAVFEAGRVHVCGNA
jgi:flavin reductase (DIM6/NTAB) family NADH-FMN oxidoreductase RutF